MPGASRIGDSHRCTLAGHRGGEIVTGLDSVLIQGKPAARICDVAECEGPSHDVILSGEPTVLIGAHPAARVGDATEGGFLSEGSSTVFVGPAPSPERVRSRARAFRKRERSQQ